MCIFSWLKRELLGSTDMQPDQNEHRDVPFTHTCSVCDYYRQDLHRRLEYGMVMSKSEVKHKPHTILLFLLVI